MASLPSRESMNEQTTSMRRKSYTEIEEEFLKSCAKLALERKFTNAEAARYISPLLGRTSKGIEQKLSFVKQDVLLEEKKRMWIYEDELSEINQYFQETKDKPTSDFGSTTIQSFKQKMPEGYERLLPLDTNDIGKRLKVRVYNLKPYGAFCETEDGKTGLMIRSMVTTEFVDNIEDYIQIGDVFEAIVVPDKQNPDKVLLNAKKIGNLIPIKDRNK